MQTKPTKIVVFTGAGVSADSGIATFRDADGLWANYRIEDVCTPEALMRDRATVIEFYNKRRKELLEKEPNAAHYAIAELEEYFDVESQPQPKQPTFGSPDKGAMPKGDEGAVNAFTNAWGFGPKK